MSREGCFWCGYLGKDIIRCTADNSVSLNPFLLLDEYPEECPKKKGVVMEYKGFRTTNIEQNIISDEESVFSIKVINSADYLEVSANNLDDIEPKFHKAIDDYIELCNNFGKNPFQKE